MPLRMLYVCMSRFYRHPKPLVTLVFLSVFVVFFGVFKLFFYKASKPTRMYEGTYQKIQGSIELSGPPPRELENEGITANDVCILADLDKYHKGISQYVQDFGELKCSGETYGSLNNGKLQVKGKGLGNILYHGIYFRSVAADDEDVKQQFQLGEQNTLQRIDQEKHDKFAPGKTGSVQHVRGRCIHPYGGSEFPAEGTEVVLWQECDLDRIKFEFTQEGFLRHTSSKKCIRTKGGVLRAERNTPLVFSSKCDEAAKFSMTSHQTLKHVASGLCIHDRDGDDDPPDNAPLVLRVWCDKAFLRYFLFDPSKKSKQNLDKTADSVHDDFIKLNIQIPGKPACCRDVSEHLLQVFPKKDAANRIQTNGRSFDVLLIMLRSISYAHFQRKMPKTFSFLNNQMKAVMFKGFSSIGESAKSQLSAMLAGMSPSESQGKSMDDMPWIFKKFEEKGYVTMFSEDRAASTEFKDVLSGFGQPPVDHFAEPFWSSAKSSQEDPVNSHLCFGKKAVHNLSLAYMEDFFTAYGTEKNRFGMVFNSEMSYENPINTIGYMDKDLKETLQRMKNSGKLDRTFLFVFSNHGMSSGRIRETLQGKLEERSPLLMLSLPAKLTNFEEVQKNLEHNKKFLISPYDVHATLNHIGNHMKMTSKITGSSILNKLNSKLQKCETTGIPKVWCPCLNSHSVNAEGPYVKKIAEYIVEEMNKRLETHNSGEKCSELNLGGVNVIENIKPNDLVLSFKYSRSKEDCLLCETVISKSSLEKVTNDLLYRVQVSVLPGNNVYESQVNIVNGQIVSCSEAKLVSGEIGQCLSNVEDTSLREICICK